MTTPTTAATSEPPSMPHPNQDPDFAAARQVQTDYKAAVAAVRTAPPSQMTEIARAEKIAEAYATYEQGLKDAGERLTARRQQRLDWLNAQLPIGHGIPDDTVPAARMMLVTAFREQYEKASNSDRAGRAQMLDQADRFGDEQARRAALTAIIENGEHNTLRDRPDRYGATFDHLKEAAELRQPSSLVLGFQSIAFNQQKKPNEAIQLPYMQKRQAERDAEALRQRHRGYF